MSETITAGDLREVVGRCVLNFRARSASTKYTSGHAPQPSDVNALADQICLAIAIRAGRPAEECKAP